MPIPKDIEAEIYFLTTEEGGRILPVPNIFHSQFYYDNHDWDARFVFPGLDKVNLGDTALTHIGFLSPNEHLVKMFIGMQFLVRSGAHTIGNGVVTNIIELKDSASRVKQSIT